MIHYSIQAIDPAAHLFGVSCRIDQPDANGQQFSLPAWIPGSYMIRDFAKNIVRLSASCDGKSVAVKKLDKQTWQCAPCDGELIVSYEVYAWDLSVRTAHLDTTHGYFNGASVFVFVMGREAEAVTVDILQPEGEAFQNWRVATAMQCQGAKAYGFGRYGAENYDELIDHPVEMGEFTLASFDACGIPHDVVLTGRHRADMDRLCQDLKTICEFHLSFFDHPYPIDRYVFMVMVVGDGYGGLEHRASTSLLCSRKDLPLKGMDNITEEYRNFLGLCSHEYFHTWNVKRIKPEKFLPYDLSQETPTDLLWVFEGFTAYYDDLSLVRSGVIEPKSYLELLGQTCTRVWRGKGRFKQSVAESSFDAWTKFYKQDENAVNAIVSYYTKGSLGALALDLTIRKLSQGEKSLDDVMCYLWKEHGLPLKGVAEDQMPSIVKAATGFDLEAEIQRFFYATEDAPLAELLADVVGVEFHLRATENATDKGGKPGSSEKELVSLGALVDAGAEARLNIVFENGAAQQAGLSAGDVIIAINQLRVKGADCEKILQTYPVGEKVRVHAFRRDELMEFDMTITASEKNTVYLTQNDSANADQQQRFNEWVYQK